METYRICKNDFNWYKIQIWHRPITFLGITIRKGKWIDTYFKPRSTICNKFKTKEGAELGIKKLLTAHEKNHKSWYEIARPM